MPPKIDISTELYDRLSKLAEGFETPASVIERALNERPPKPDSLCKTLTPAITGSFGDVRNLLERAFQEFFNVKPRSFGQKTGAIFGFSDDAKGVQWNAGINLKDGTAVLGVNLEGMKYRDWPIATLLLRETVEPTLTSLKSIKNAEKISVQLSRDAWQCAARPPIKERFIHGSGVKLNELSTSKWSSMVGEALSCLDSTQAHRGRAEQLVTLIKSGEPVKKEVSPHLSLTTPLWAAPPTNIEALLDSIRRAHQILLPVYNFIRELCVDKSKEIFKKEIHEGSVEVDTDYSIYTYPRSFGVYEIKGQHTGKIFRQGNHPIRLKELIKEFGHVTLKALYLDKELAVERARFENGN